MAKTKSTVGLLLTNVGSPDHADLISVTNYLKKFLSDKRIIQLPKLIWQPILNRIVLPLRAKKSTELYQKIWTELGSPLTLNSTQLAKQLSTRLSMPVAVGMHYGNPSIECAIEKLQSQSITQLIILPLFPQYSTTTTAVTWDQVTPFLTSLELISKDAKWDYAEHPDYISALCDEINRYSIQHLLFSFHGIPKRYLKTGDCYQERCYKTVQLITEKLKWPSDKWSLAFQSRFGKAKWLTPDTHNLLKEFPKRNIKNLHVICPGFAVDCLETLEEIAIRGKEEFLNAGGKEFSYIPALNLSEHGISFFEKLIAELLSKEEHVQFQN